MKRLAFALVPVLFACSSAGGSDTDGGAAAGGAAGAGGSGGMGGAMLPMRPDPGPPPKSAIGVLSLTSSQGNDGALKNRMGGLFLMPAKDLSLPDQQSLFTYYADIPIDTCTVPPAFSLMSGDMPMSIDAGAIQLTLPNGVTGEIGKSVILGMFTVYNSDLPADAFQAGGKYHVAGSGAVAPGFSGDFYAPSDLTVTTPALPAGKPLQISLDKPIELAWKGTRDGSPVFVQIRQPGTLMVCRLTDDGAFTIPKAALGSFKPSPSSGGSDPDQLIVQKYTWYMAGQVLIETTSGMTLDINLQ